MPRLDPSAADEWEAKLQRDGVVEFRPNRRRIALLLLVSILFTVIGGLMIASGDSLRNTVVGWLAILLFGALGIPALGWTLATGGRRTIITRAGVEVPNGFDVPWTDITEVLVMQTRRTRIVLLRLTGEAARDRALAGHRVARALSGLSDAITKGTDLALPAPLPVDARVLAGLLHAHCRGEHP